MSQDSALESKVKAQISRFAARLTHSGYSKPKRRFVSEMLFGIQAGKDVNRAACDAQAGAYRFVKESYDVEDVRVRNYTALRNVYALVTAVLGRKARLNLFFTQVCDKAKRFYEIAAFFHYAVADGIHRLLFAWHTGAKFPPKPRNPNQLLLQLAKPPG